MKTAKGGQPLGVISENAAKYFQNGVLQKTKVEGFELRDFAFCNLKNTPSIIHNICR